MHYLAVINAIRVPLLPLSEIWTDHVDKFHWLNGNLRYRSNTEHWAPSTGRTSCKTITIVISQIYSLYCNDKFEVLHNMRLPCSTSPLPSSLVKAASVFRNPYLCFAFDVAHYCLLFHVSSSCRIHRLVDSCDHF